ncbi:hypothetical protein P9B03_14935 [Metasolibacillus meyeri]|uniref:Uncharacterized protein n=1 Tax=Metasolibacillus meyeri TaxID=1071052 RepID=A0AAW9NQG3_9BACL|nr:hypothetical protein [Metasolibacillus meyeri]MEC1179792.1 hypothetical protein [Metasolibacillus meyeri]
MDVTSWIKSLAMFKVDSKYEDLDEIDYYLEQRDAELFDSQWMEAHNNFTAIIESMNNEAVKRQLEELQSLAQEQFYKTIIKQTGHSDLAAYLSDDIYLIVGYLTIGHSNDFVLAMKMGYEHGEFPKVGGI